MKRKITLLLLAASTALTMNSQVVFQDNFTSTWNPATQGWAIVNNSSPVGTTSVFQGNGSGVFPAYNGGINDYVGMNFNSVSGQGGISTWLMTPTLNIYNGAVLSFATRKTNVATTFPDRMQVRMSSTTSSVIPSGTTSVGAFTTLLLDFNPTLLNVSATAVNNGSVAGYPNAWTVYTLQVSGVTGTVQGRFAFRYFVNDGGQNGANSDYIGIDAVNYTLPCGTSVGSYTSCAGAAAVLNATGGLSSTTYSWSNGATTFSTAVTPTVTTPGATQVYTLYPSVGGSVSCGVSQTATITIGTQLNVNVSASSSTICSGNPVTLTANGPTSTYTWVNGATIVGSGAVITVTPGTTTTYSVGSLNGACQGGNSITITVNASPSPSVSMTPACLGGSITITASGANSYTYLASSANPQTIASPTAVGGYFFTLVAANANGCQISGNVTFTVNPTPTVQVTSSKAVECINRTITLTASGADTYSWSGAATGTTSPITYSTGTTAGNKTFTVVGTTSLGCSGTAVRTISVSLCTGIENQFGNLVETSVFPNPFTNELKIGGLNGSVDIYNALGQVILSTKVNDTETINTADLTKGVYILKAYSNEGQELKTIKLLKN